ncbi:MAG: DUF2277 domain-containing protein [Acidobacteriaceae bacterium]|nr:DUF2277 domain-containing protein [Acidobacteriaceae bacterium]
MCRSIKVLAKSQASEDEIAAAALQFVRKVSGTRKPSKKNQAAFEAAVQEITSSTQRLLVKLAPTEPRP